MVTLYNSVDRYTAKKLTKEKRKFQTCKVYEVKVDRSHLSNETIKHLNNVSNHRYCNNILKYL